MIIAIALLVVVLGLALAIPGTRAIAWPLMTALYYVTWGVIRMALGLAGVAMPVITVTLITALVALTIVVVIGGVAALGFHSYWTLVAAAAVLGIIILFLRMPFAFMPWGLTKSIAKKLGDWANVLFWAAWLMLFLPMFTISPGITVLAVIALCSMILLSSEIPSLRVIIRWTTVGAMLLLVTTTLWAPARRAWTDLRFTNLNQMAVVPTTESIEDLMQQKIQHSQGWTREDETNLRNLQRREVTQQTYVQAAAVRRQTSARSGNGSFLSLGEYTKTTVMVMAGLIGMILLVATKTHNLSGH